MKILTIHADFIEFEAKKKAFKGAEEGIAEGKQRVEECLVVLTAVEKRDEADPKAVLERYIQEIKNIAQQVNAKNIVLYPYAHLSSQLSNPKVAEQLMKDAEEILKEKYEVSRAPFGWYKKFNLACKGHPLSELSREFSSEEISKKEEEPIVTKEQISDNATYKKLIKFLDDGNAHYRLIDHSPEGKTAIVSQMRGNKLSQGAHCVVLMVKINKKEKRHVLAVVPGDARVDIEAVKNLFNGTYATFANKESAEKLSGSVSGTILPFSFNPELELIVDPKLLENEELFFNAARLDRSLALKTKDYERLANPKLENIAKYEITTKEDHTKDLTPEEREELLKKMSRVSMSAPPGKDGLKSNVELGKELDLYFVSEVVGGGLPLLTPRGATIKREIERFVTDEELKRGYLYTSTPIMAKSDLYKISGHWQHYKDDMFVLQVRGETFALRPMTCPFQFVIYKHKPRSYKDLPIRYAEIASLFRNEKSGELRGLTRLRQFTLADAHIICQPEKLEEEFGKVLELLKFVMDKLGIKDIWYRFSKYDPEDKSDKYIKNTEAWEESQKMMKEILDRLGVEYVEADGEAAFYGPKLDLQYKDVYGKEDTLITLQIDFALPEKYDLTYTDADGKEKRPMVIHRSSSGATERTMAYILEKYQGKLPLWLSPVQVKVLTINDNCVPFAKEVVEKLVASGLRVELDDRTETLGKKVREAQIEKVNYVLTVGDKEVEKKSLAVRNRAGEQKFDVNVDEFVAQLRKEVDEKTIE